MRPLHLGRFVAYLEEARRWCGLYRSLVAVSTAAVETGLDVRLKVSVAKIVMSPRSLVDGTADTAPNRVRMVNRT
jgi:hypothetical protein